MSGHVPAFAELEDRLKHDGIEADPTSIGSVILGLATADDWTKHPDRFGEWLEQLAMDMIRLRNPHLVKTGSS
jgi:hypothetical protein